MSHHPHQQNPLPPISYIYEYYSPFYPLLSLLSPPTLTLSSINTLSGGRSGQFISITSKVRMSLRSARLSSISSNSSEDFWQQFEGKKNSHSEMTMNKRTFAATLKLKMQTLLGKKQSAAQQQLKNGPIRPKPVPRDNFDPLIQDYEIKLRASRLRDDTDYLREYTINFNKYRATKQFQEMVMSAVYDDVFSDQYSSEDLEDAGVCDYSDVFEEEYCNYSDVCENSVNNDYEDYSDVYSEYSKISEYSLEDEARYTAPFSAPLPPPLPRRMSDSRPPARPPVPCKSNSFSRQKPQLPPRV